MDGDSFAHRAYHALPGSMRREDGGPANALIGFSDMLMRLWRDEQPRTVLVAWDTLDVPTYRHEALDAYQSGRVFDDELLEQLDLLPGVVASMGFAYAKEAGYEADDFLAAAAAHEEAAGGTALVATSDRDAFQLVTDRVTVLQPAKGVRRASARPRSVSATASIRLRCRTSSRSAATLGQDPRSTRHRHEARRGAPRAVRLARRDARGGSLRHGSGCSSALPSHRDDGPRRAAAPASGRHAGLGGAAEHATQLKALRVARRFEEALTWT